MIRYFCDHCDALMEDEQGVVVHITKRGKVSRESPKRVAAIVLCDACGPRFQKALIEPHDQLVNGETE